MFSKFEWKKKVWARASDLEDVFWEVEFRTRKHLDIIRRTSSSCIYLTWWYLSDKYPHMMSMCETIAKLVCHASLLKSDDVRLRRLNRSSRFCSLCDLSEEDNVNHLVLQCPRLQAERNAMFVEIRALRPGNETIFENGTCDTLGILLGQPVERLSLDNMDDVWLTAGTHISHMYRQNLNLREGIG